MTKKVFLSVLVGFVMLTSMVENIYAQADYLQLANEYYDKDSYYDAKNYFQKTIESGNINGEILYKYAYSTEMTDGLNENTLKLYAAAYSYFTKNNETGHRYCTNAKRKLESNMAGLLNLTREDVDLIIGNIGTKTTGIINNMEKVRYISEDTLTALAIIIIPLLIIVYIIALVCSYKTKCVIISGWKDLIILALLSFDTIGLVYCLYDGAGTGYITTLGIIFMVLFIFTIKYSITANISIIPHGMIFACLSILTKVLMLIIIPLIILLYSYYTGNSAYKTDRRYRDGTKGNTKTAKVAAFVTVVAFLVGALVKNRKTKIVVEDRINSDGFHSPEVTFKR